MSHSLNTVVVHKYTLNKKKQPIGHNTAGGKFPQLFWREFHFIAPSGFYFA